MLFLELPSSDSGGTGAPRTRTLTISEGVPLPSTFSVNYQWLLNLVGVSEPASSFNYVSTTVQDGGGIDRKIRILNEVGTFVPSAATLAVLLGQANLAVEDFPEDLGPGLTY